MEHPDFSRHSHDELRQILTRLDRERFPERAAEIERRLAEPKPAPAMPEHVAAAGAADRAPAWAGLWRRASAFAIDMALLALAGAVLGALFGDRLQVLGVWGRLLGLGMALAYFTLLESGMGRGQTPGKALLDIAVRDAAGNRLRPSAAAARMLVWAVPFFLNGAPLPVAPDNIPVYAILSLLVFGLACANAYLLVVDRPARRSLADRLFGTVVVRARDDDRMPAMPSSWRGHRWVVAAILLLSLATPVAMMKLVSAVTPIGPLLATQARLHALPGVRDVGIVRMKNLNQPRGAGALHINLVLASQQESDPQALARSAAQVALQTYPDAPRLDTIDVTLATGYDIGIWSSWRSQTMRAAPAQWAAASDQSGVSAATPR